MSRLTAFSWRFGMVERNALQQAGDGGRRIARCHRMPYGAALEPSGAVRFRLWAPAHARIAVAFEDGGAWPLQPVDDGWHELVTDRARAGSRYQFVLPNGLRVPDPASRFQPNDVHGPSEVINPAAYPWRDDGWIGRPWTEAVLYELHVGAFTPAGTFSAAIERLDHLARLGVTAVEIMPVGDFPGRRNWGYDGVLPYAPDASYGRPEDLKGLVEAAHARGLMVLLDVVYNHFGPDGNYLGAYAPQFFTERHHTPWGAAINYDGPDSRPVRDFVVHNALYWLEEFHFDGLRLDAVHAIADDSPEHILTEIARRARAAISDRPLHLVLENEENEARRLTRDADGRPCHYIAQWNDDVHHGLHVAATGEAGGYYADYRGRTDLLARSLAEGFAFQGEVMAYRDSPRGEPSAMLPPEAFVAFIQNHDQIGNRAFGERITALASSAAVRAIAAIYLLLPQVPLLFMGEEWGATQPFPFFCDFSGELAEAVRRGRRAEFARFPEFQAPAARDRIPDPQADSTFAAAKLRWNELALPEHAEWRELYRRLLATRRDSIAPLLPRLAGNAGSYTLLADNAFVVRWQAADDTVLCLAANLGDATDAKVPPTVGQIIWQEGEFGEDGSFGAWSLRWSIELPLEAMLGLDDAAITAASAEVPPAGDPPNAPEPAAEPHPEAPPIVAVTASTSGRAA